MASYHAETHWSRVGREIAQRQGPNFVAGDDHPYYRYKRAKFLERFLDTLDVDGKTVVEVGCGPGGNLKHLLEHRHAAQLMGVDIAQPMVDLARTHLPPSVEITKVDGSSLPFADQSIDLTYTVTVLQHNTFEPMLRGLAHEICRVTRSTVVLMEDVGDHRQMNSDGDYLARDPKLYEDLMRAGGFQPVSTRSLNTRLSRTWMRLAVSAYRRVDSRPHQEGEPFPSVLRWLMAGPMAVTTRLDDRFPERRDLVQMVFRRATLG
jgi:SAM-dependent methyltransferase